MLCYSIVCYKKNCGLFVQTVVAVFFLTNVVALFMYILYLVLR